MSRLMRRIDRASPLALGLVSAACCAAGWLVLALVVVEIWG